MSKGKGQHVVPHQGSWAVRREGSERSSSVHATQGEAIERARDIAINQGGEVVIHGRDGKIRDKDSYGHDPCPPRDKKH